ncbi:MAG: V-type ATPase subunit, partial [Thermoplasmata archaeon]|nr:V-type ATPase subunit [Thermoplasmata archaeon]
MHKRSGRPGNYAYTVARVKAKKSKLLKEEDYNKMLQLSVPEVARYISDAGYGKEVTDLASQHEGIDLVEYATYSNMANTFGSILGSSQGELKDMVAAYLEKWDIWNLKVLLRGKSFGLDAASLKEDLVPAGKLDAEDLDKLISIDSTEDIIATFAKMMSMNQAELVGAYKNATNGLGDLEDMLDKKYYTRLLSKINPATRPGYMFQDWVRTEIDAKNLETILKLKAEGIYGEPVMKYIIPGGKEIDSRLATQMANEETVAGVVNDSAQLQFSEFLKDLVENDKVLIRDVVHEINKYEIAQAKKFSHMY